MDCGRAQLRTCHFCPNYNRVTTWTELLFESDNLNPPVAGRTCLAGCERAGGFQLVNSLSCATSETNLGSTPATGGCPGIGSGCSSAICNTSSIFSTKWMD